MHRNLKKWLDELNDEVVIVHASDIDDEANGNLVTFGVPGTSLKEWGQDSVIEFVLECRDLYRKRCSNTPMKFYSWYDEQAGQLRISAVSATHNKLPFRCQIIECNLSEMVEGLFNERSGLYGEEEKLYVWQSII